MPSVLYLRRMNPLLRAICALSVLFFLSYLPCSSQNTGYKARYTVPDRIFIGSTSIGTKDGGTIVAGKWGQTSEDSSRVMVTKFDPLGNIVWSKYVNTGGLLETFVLCEMSDGSIAVAADLHYYINMVNFADVLLVKFNCRGEILWNNRVNMTTSPGQKTLIPESVREGSNGDLLLSFFSTGNTTTNPITVICRVDNTGKLVWSKTFSANPNAPNTGGDYESQVFYRDNSVLVFGFKDAFDNTYSNNKQMYAMQLDYSTGAVVMLKSYNYSEFSTNYGLFVTWPRIFFDAEQLADGTYALFGLFSNFNYQDAYVYRLIINKDLSINQTKAFHIPYNVAIPYGCITVLPNGQTHITSQNYDDYTVYWYSADNAFSTIRSIKIPYANNSIFGGNVVSQSGPTRSDYLLDGYDNQTQQHYLELTQVEDGKNNILPCLGTDTPFVNLTPLQVNTGSWSWVSVADNQVLIAGTPYLTGDIPVSKNYLCAPDLAVPSFTIEGPSAICSTTSVYEYHVSTSNAANKPVLWTADPATYKLLETVNDSTVRISFADAQAGPYTMKLTASGSACSPVQQTFSITVYPGASLPRYVTICKQPVPLDAGNWFSSYLWQDGTTSPTYTVSKEGRYILNLTTFCGDKLTDTTDAFSDKLGIQGAPVICLHDTAVLKAPGGLASYQWTPATNLLAVNDSIAEVYPDINTAYILSSLTTDGCSLKDTIQVSVRKPPVVNLGADTVICLQDKLTLFAGPSYADYAWSTGESTASITVKAPGQFNVQVKDQYGCRGGDTIDVQGRYCTDQIYFPNAFSPDGNGANDIFRPRVLGQLDQYEMTIFNRWGEMVFRSENPAEGWDGAYKGTLLQTGAFVWACRYKFSDAGVKTEKGTLLLVR